MLLSLAEAPRAHEKRKNTDQDTQTEDKPQAELNSTDCAPHEKVFNTTEILEGILECLPAKTLFLVQRVNKRFHETITGSSRIQRKMFLRIDNDQSLVWEAHSKVLGIWSLTQAPPEAKRLLLVVTPVVLNPCLECVRPDDIKFGAFVGGGEHLSFRCHTALSYQQFEQQSIGKGFLSDPQGTRIHVKLCFALGSIGTIDVPRLVTSDTPLTIEELVTRVMETHGKVAIFRQRMPALRLGIPREIISELQHRTGLEVTFKPSDSKFHLPGFVAPTDEERVAVKSYGLEK